MALTAGDTDLATLNVDPANGTTTAVLTVTAPDGTTATPEVTPSNARATWTATVVYTTGGAWILRWVVTGTGAGVEYQEILVGPAPALGRSYATTADLADHLDEAPPVGARKLLRDATRAIDDLLLSAVYDVDDDGLPTATAEIEALKLATCMQVEWWAETGDPLGAAAMYQQVTAGGISLGRGYSAAGSATGPGQLHSDRAVQELRRAGLLGQEPWSGC